MFGINKLCASVVEREFNVELRNRLCASVVEREFNVELRNRSIALDI